MINRKVWPKAIQRFRPLTFRPAAHWLVGRCVCCLASLHTECPCTCVRGICSSGYLLSNMSGRQNKHLILIWIFIFPPTMIYMLQLCICNNLKCTSLCCWSYLGVLVYILTSLFRERRSWGSRSSLGPVRETWRPKRTARQVKFSYESHYSDSMKASLGGIIIFDQ